MIPVNQTICDFKNGNCMQACIASLFEIELKDIPNFMKDGKEYYNENLNKWAKENGLVCFDISTSGDFEKIFKDIYVIVVGKSPRNESEKHSVIYLNGKMVHDPHPDKTGIIGKPELVSIFAKAHYKS